MKIYHEIKNFPRDQFTIVTMGTFDGVHCGHREILRKMSQIASEKNGETVVVIFSPHPREVLKMDVEKLQFLTTHEEKIRLLSGAGVDHLIIYPFTLKLSALTAEDFIRSIFVGQMKANSVVIGHDHHFGKLKSGDFELLKTLGEKYSFDCLQIAPVVMDGMTVSATKIRNLISEGDVHQANIFLGYAYSITGKVIPGRKTGKTIGFPTANLSVPEEKKLIPAAGVYAARAIWKQNELKGMVNIGYRPTFGGQPLAIEIHLFGFSEEIYGDILEIRFIQRIREEVKFDNIQSLTDQLQKDRDFVMNLFK